MRGAKKYKNVHAQSAREGNEFHHRPVRERHTRTRPSGSGVRNWVHVCECTVIAWTCALLMCLAL